MMLRYKVQQDKGHYCLKGCDDGDLVDYSEYAALESRLAAAEASLTEYDARWKLRNEYIDGLQDKLAAAEKERDDARWCLDIARMNYRDQHPWHDNFTAKVLAALGRSPPNSTEKPTDAEIRAGVSVDPELAKKYPDVGDVRRYGAMADDNSGDQHGK